MRCLQAEPHVDRTFLLVNSDNVLEESVEPAVEATGEADAALAVEEVSLEVTTTTGVIEMDEEERVTGIVEKPANPSLTLVKTGATSFPRTCFTRVRCSDSRLRVSTS
jgi:glucose-1-phosphate thymidylyltransferase